MKNRQERPSGSCIPTKTSTPLGKACLVTRQTHWRSPVARNPALPLLSALTMDSRMREKDKIDDILVANRASDEDDLKKGIRVNVTSPLALSAQFIRLAEAGVQSGLSSGEGLAEAAKLAGSDPRLLFVEKEFSSVWKHADRRGNSLPMALRKAWDGGSIQIVTKKD